MKKLTEKQLRRHVAKVEVPSGFTAEFKVETWRAGPNVETWLTYVLEKEGDTKIVFDQNGSGHTTFLTDAGWRTFDRRGVEDSFYHIPLFEGDEVKDLNEIVADQLKRIEEKRTYYKTAVSVPDLPFTVAPEGVEDLKKRLKKNGSISFTPSGFGTGYVVSKRRPPGFQYGGKMASPELEKFLGLSPLYITTMDCD